MNNNQDPNRRRNNTARQPVKRTGSNSGYDNFYVDSSQGQRRYRQPPASKRRSPFATIAIIATAALFCVLLAWGALHISGYRYERIKVDSLVTSNGSVINESGYIKFLGKVDENGEALSGSVTYPGGTKGTIDVKAGKIAYTNGNLYTGEIDKLQPNGEGKLIFIDSASYYIGEFINSVISGAGTYYYANGDIYAGEFLNGKKHGTGVYTFADGSSYSGGFYEDAKNGEGVFVYADGASFTGTFEKNQKTGSGTFIYSNGDKYTGNFENDVRSGKGVYEWTNGETYVGMFANNQMHGEGTYTWPSGRIYSGTFSEGAFLTE